MSGTIKRGTVRRPVQPKRKQAAKPSVISSGISAGQTWTVIPSVYFAS